jgi:toxin ParE1/3/4
MARFILSPQAQDSLTQIRNYSSENFGEQQAKRYLDTINDKLQELAKTPSKGKPRDDIKAGYRSAFVESHTIYYMIADEHIEILDVLHQRMEPTLHL